MQKQTKTKTKQKNKIFYDHHIDRSDYPHNEGPTCGHEHPATQGLVDKVLQKHPEMEHIFQYDSVSLNDNNHNHNHKHNHIYNHNTHNDNDNDNNHDFIHEHHYHEKDTININGTQQQIHKTFLRGTPGKVCVLPCLFVLFFFCVVVCAW